MVNVVALFKNDCKENPENYRPVSLSLVAGTLFLEGMLRNRIDQRLDKQGVIRESA